MGLPNEQRFLPLVGAVALVLITGCKSENQRQREINACIAVNTDKRRAYTNGIGVALCLQTNYDWSSEDAQDIQTLVDKSERDLRRHQDSVRRQRRQKR